MSLSLLNSSRPVHLLCSARLAQARSFHILNLSPSLRRPELNAHLHNRPPPPKRDAESIFTPEEFLTAIGRECETKYEAPSKWSTFWSKTDKEELKAKGVSVKDRRYILWCMEKFRQGLPISTFAHQPKPPKTVRGWGPKVQNGKRIRSKRIKTAPQGEKCRV